MHKLSLLRINAVFNFNFCCSGHRIEIDPISILLYAHNPTFVKIVSGRSNWSNESFPYKWKLEGSEVGSSEFGSSEAVHCSEFSFARPKLVEVSFLAELEFQVTKRLKPESLLESRLYGQFYNQVKTPWTSGLLLKTLNFNFQIKN